jgi:hypothetical protein
MTQVVTGPDGVDHEFPDDTPDDVIKGVMQKTYGGGGSFADAMNNVVKPGAKLAGRTAERVALGPADLLASGSKALGKEFDKTGWFAPQPTLLDSDKKTVIGGYDAPLPSEQMIADTGMTMDKDAGAGMQVADFVAPLIANAGRSALSKASSIPGFLSQAAKNIGWQGAETAVGAGAGEGAKMLGADDLGVMASSLVGAGGLRTGMQAAGTSLIAKAVANQAAPAIMAAAERLGIKPTFGMLSNILGKNVEKHLMSNPFAGGGVNAKRDAVQTALDSRISQEAGNVGYAGDPLERARSPDVTGGDLTQSAQRQMVDSARQDDARQGRLEAAIGGDTATDISELMRRGRQLAGSAQTDPLTGSAPLNPRLDALDTLIRRQNPPQGPMTDQEAAAYFSQPGNAQGPLWDQFLAGQPVTPPYDPPPEVAYGGLKDWRRGLGRSMTGADPLSDAHKGQLYGDATAAMRGAADERGLGEVFDNTQDATRRMHQEQMPVLEPLGGQMGGTRNGVQQFDKTPAAGAANSLFEGAASTGGNPALMERYGQQLPGDSLARGLADIVRRSGTKDINFRPEDFGKDWRQVNQPARDLMSTFSPSTPRTLDDVASLGDAFRINPSGPGLSNSLGFQAALAQLPGGFIPKTLATAAILKGIESPSMLNALAGRGGIGTLLAEYARNQPVMQQTIQRAIGP